MANRYWVGGTANWDNTVGTKWATVPGGAGGASIPTTADDVFFTSTGVVTMVTATAKSINCTGFTGTLTGTAAITVAGSITLVDGMTYSHTGTVTITGTGTLTTAGKTFGTLVVNGNGITVTLGSALNTGGRTITITRGNFNTDNYNVTASLLESSNSNPRSITLGSSTITLTNTGTALNFATGTNLTFNAGTSQINLSGSAANIYGSQTYYNVSFTNIGSGTRTIRTANTFNNLVLVQPTTLTVTWARSELAIYADQTVNGTFTCAGASGVRRCWIRSDIIGTTRTITAATLSANDCDFRDITIAGGAAGTSPIRAGDCGGNSGINFPAAKTVYWNPTSATSIAGTAAWVTSSGGTNRSADNFPLAQDTAVFDNNSTVNMGGNLSIRWNIGQIDLSQRTNAFGFSYGSPGYTIYKGWSTGSGVTYSGTGISIIFSGRETMTFSTAGKTWANSIIIDAPSGTLELGDSFSSSQGITHTRGTFDAKTYNVTCSTFTSIGSNTRTLSMGSGLWTLSGTGTVWNCAATNLTLNKDTADILLSNTTTTARTFTGGDQSYNELTIGGTTGSSTTTIGGTNTFSGLSSTKTVAHTISLGANQNITTWNVKGTSGNVVTVNSTVAGTRRTITLTNATDPANNINYLNVKDIGITDANRFYVGANSTNGGNNLNVIFTAAPGLPPPASTGNMFFMFI